MLVTLVWSSPALCGEIHDAAWRGDLDEVKALLKENSDLVFTKDKVCPDRRPGHTDCASERLIDGATAWHFAVEEKNRLGVFPQKRLGLSKTKTWCSND
jgi:hypothetical protein